MEGVLFCSFEGVMRDRIKPMRSPSMAGSSHPKPVSAKGRLSMMVQDCGNKTSQSVIRTLATAVVPTAQGHTLGNLSKNVTNKPKRTSTIAGG